MKTGRQTPYRVNRKRYDRVLTLIHQHPGITTQKLQAHFARTHATIRDWVLTLKREGRVTVLRDRYLFARDAVLTAEEFAHILGLRVGGRRLRLDVEPITPVPGRLSYGMEPPSLLRRQAD